LWFEPRGAHARQQRDATRRAARAGSAGGPEGGTASANVYGLSRAVPTRGSSATQRVALPEPARPAGRRAAPRRLLTGVGRSRTSDMGFVAVLKQEFAAKRQRIQTFGRAARAVQATLMTDCAGQKRNK